MQVVVRGISHVKPKRETYEFSGARVLVETGGWLKRHRELKLNPPLFEELKIVPVWTQEGFIEEGSWNVVVNPTVFPKNMEPVGNKWLIFGGSLEEATKKALTTLLEAYKEKYGIELPEKVTIELIPGVPIVFPSIMGSHYLYE